MFLQICSGRDTYFHSDNSCSYEIDANKIEISHVNICLTNCVQNALRNIWPVKNFEQF